MMGCDDGPEPDRESTRARLDRQPATRKELRELREKIEALRTEVIELIAQNKGR